MKDFFAPTYIHQNILMDSLFLRFPYLLDDNLHVLLLKLQSRKYF